LLTRPINDPVTTFDHVTDTTGDITSTSLPFASTSLAEENYIEATTSESDENIIFNVEDDDEVSFSVEDAIEDESIIELVQPDPLTVIDSVPSPRRSNRIRKVNMKYDDNEWASLAKEIKEEEEIPWSHYGDPTLFTPEPRGLKTIIKLQNSDPIAYKVWVRAIKSEIKNLISQGTFV